MISLLALAAILASAQDAPRLMYGQVTPFERPTPALLALGEILRDAPAAKPKEIAPEETLDLIPVTREGRAGWVKTAASLLLYDSSGTLVNEVGLGAWSEPGSPGITLRRTVRGGISKDGRFAWSWEKAESLKDGRNEKPQTTARLMRYLGTEGQELFRNELADAPPGLQPVVVADNGEKLLVMEHGLNAWIVGAFDFTGNRLVDAHGKGLIELAELTGSGDFALVRWHQLDMPPEYSHLQLQDRKFATIDAIPKAGASAALTSDGRVLLGGKLVYPKQ